MGVIRPYYNIHPLGMFEGSFAVLLALSGSRVRALDQDCASDAEQNQFILSMVKS